MRGSKGWVYEGGIRVPMVVRAPELFKAGVMSDDLAHFTDCLPTLLAATGMPPVGDLPLDGRDLSPILRGDQAGEPPPRFRQFNFYAPDIGTNAAMRDGNWKLLQPMISGTRFFREELCKGEEDVARTRAFVEAELKHREDPSAIREILSVPGLKRLEPELPQLYDLSRDPGEQQDLASAQPERTRRMLTELQTWFENVETDRRSINEEECSGSSIGWD